jgi:hypothetical protein
MGHGGRDCKRLPELDQQGQMEKMEPLQTNQGMAQMEQTELTEPTAQQFGSTEVCCFQAGKKD